VLSANVYTYRHNLVSDLVEAACITKGWTLVSRGVDVPASLVHPFRLKTLKHTRPDLVLIDTHTENLLRVAIVEVTVVFESDSNIAAANDRKSDLYKPLIQAIQDSRPQQQMEITIAVVIVGARGIIPTFWFENLQPLQLSKRAATKLAKQSSAAAIKGSQWIWGLWTSQAHGSNND